MIDATRQTFFSPYDDLQDVLLAFIDKAQHKIRIADYSFNLDPLVDKLIAKHNAGIDVALVLDKSQAGGSTEKPEVQKLKDAGVPMVIGTSERHRIMHLKVAIVDDEWVLSGSYNFTGTAELENNFFDIEHNKERAAAFTSNWQQVFDFIQQHEN